MEEREEWKREMSGVETKKLKDRMEVGSGKGEAATETGEEWVRHCASTVVPQAAIRGITIFVYMSTLSAI